ncbi:MAG: hypothetical protein ACREL5_08070 [Gemmatimonadales bacterium]
MAILASSSARPRFCRQVAAAVALAILAGCHRSAHPSYLFVWAGDSARKASDFLAVIDATPGSSHYGAVLTSLPTGIAGTQPHHTELEMPADGHLLANGFRAGRTWLFDLTAPLQPKIITSFGDLAGFSHPHTFARLADGNLLATFQYAADTTAPGGEAGMLGRPHSTGGLVELDERGTVLRSASARDSSVSDTALYPYSVVPVPAIDRAVSTTTDMDMADSAATAQWVQIWRLSDLTLLATIALPPGPRGDEQRYSGEPKALPDGRVFVHTFDCGLYLLDSLTGSHPSAKLMHTFTGKDCGVAVLSGHWWLQTVPAEHGIVALDVTDPANPREVTRVSLGADEAPHWLAIDPSGRRLVVNSGGYVKGDRVFVVDFDPDDGHLAVDSLFRDAGSDRPGVDFASRTWPHGFTGRALPHGAVFSRP